MAEKKKMHWTDPLNPFKTVPAILNVAKNELKIKKNKNKTSNKTSKKTDNEFKPNLKRNKNLTKTELLFRKTNPWSDSNKKLRELEKRSKNKDLSHSDRAKARSQYSAVKRTRDDVSIEQTHAKNRKAATAHNVQVNKDWKKMKAGKMKKEDFMRKYPNSGTTRQHTAKMNPVQKRKFLKSLKAKKPLGTRLANMLDNK